MAQMRRWLSSDGLNGGEVKSTTLAAKSRSPPMRNNGMMVFDDDEILGVVSNSK